MTLVDSSAATAAAHATRAGPVAGLLRHVGSWLLQGFVGAACAYVTVPLEARHHLSNDLSRTDPSSGLSADLLARIKAAPDN